MRLLAMFDKQRARQFAPEVAALAAARIASESRKKPFSRMKEDGHQRMGISGFGRSSLSRIGALSGLGVVRKRATTLRLSLMG